MSVTIPPTRTVKRLVIEHENQTGVLTATWYPLWTGVDVELLNFVWAQTNTTPQAQLVDVRVTIDGEAFTAIGTNPDSAEEKTETLSLTGQPLGTNAFLDEFSGAPDSIPFGLLFNDGGVFIGLVGPIGGRLITIELRITDAVGTNQELDIDVMYHQLEAN